MAIATKSLVAFFFGLKDAGKLEEEVVVEETRVPFQHRQVDGLAAEDAVHICPVAVRHLGKLAHRNALLRQHALYDITYMHTPLLFIFTEQPLRARTGRSRITSLF